MNTFFTFCILIATIGLLVYGHEYFLHIYFERVPKSYLIEYMKFDRYQVTPSSLDEGIEYSGNLNEQIHYAPQESERSVFTQVSKHLGPFRL